MKKPTKKSASAKPASSKFAPSSKLKTKEPLLRLHQVSKAFPDCAANEKIDIEVFPGEIHAILGENGAGKSTLVKMMYGVLNPDEGEFFWKGEPVSIPTPKVARGLGISMVFQNFSLFESMTVLENIALGTDGKMKLEDLASRVEKLAKDYGLELSLDQHLLSLSPGERQRVEIVRCLLANPKVLILDEPTSVLTPQEAENLFVVLRSLVKKGCAILYISHKLEEVQKLCTRATVLRRGKVVETCDPREETPRSLARKMLGDHLACVRPAFNLAQSFPCFQISNLSLPSEDPLGTPLREVSFFLRKGEILGVAGISGNGQRECMRVLIGERKVPRSDIIIDGVPGGNLGPMERRSLGMGFVPEERLGHASAPGMNLASTAFLSRSSENPMSRFGFIDFTRSKAFAQEIIETFDVRCAGPEAKVESLSGGNLQKFIVGREILQKPSIFIVNQPTWGVDAGASVVIRQALVDLAENGAAVLVISQDLDEIFEISHQVAVMSGGHIFPARKVGDITREEVGFSMVSGKDKASEAATGETNVTV